MLFTNIKGISSEKGIDALSILDCTKARADETGFISSIIFSYPAPDREDVGDDAWCVLRDGTLSIGNN